MNRKLIRPNLSDVKSKEREPHQQIVREPQQQRSVTNSNGSQMARRPAPQTAPQNSQNAANDSSSDGVSAGKNRRTLSMDTNAEIYYYKKQIDSHTLMVIVLQDGEEIEGTIEWFDRNALKVNRKNAPNIMLLKHNIKYMYKAEDRMS